MTWRLQPLPPVPEADRATRLCRPPFPKGISTWTFEPVWHALR